MTGEQSRFCTAAERVRETVCNLPSPYGKNQCTADDIAPSAPANETSTGRRVSWSEYLGNMTSGNGRMTLITVGAIALVMGGIWTGQGLNLIPGSFMTGSTMWLSIGLILAAVGIVLIVLGLRRPRRGHTNT